MLKVKNSLAFYEVQLFFIIPTRQEQLTCKEFRTKY